VPPDAEPVRRDRFPVTNALEQRIATYGVLVFAYNRVRNGSGIRCGIAAKLCSCIGWRLLLHRDVVTDKLAASSLRCVCVCALALLLVPSDALRDDLRVVPTGARAALRAEIASQMC
jgi:hypothetical protein